MIRRILPITSEEENFRLVPVGGLQTIRRDGVEPVPVGTIVAMAFRITGYDRDCDGSLMARLEQIDKAGESSGWAPKGLGLYPDSTWVLDNAADLDVAADGQPPARRG